MKRFRKTCRFSRRPVEGRRVREYRLPQLIAVVVNLTAPTSDLNGHSQETPGKILNTFMVSRN